MFEELQNEIQKARANYRSVVDTGNRREVEAASAMVKHAQNTLIDALTSGAVDCPTCGARPTGILQPSEEFGQVVEIGCLCQFHRARGHTSEHAVQQWNQGAALKPKPHLSKDTGLIDGLPRSWYCKNKERGNP